VSPSRIVVTVAGLLLLVVSGWSMLPRPPSDLARMTGCSWIQTEQLIVRGQVVVDVRASGCAAEAANASFVRQTEDHVAAVTWQTLRRPVDEVRVRVDDGLGAETVPVVYEAAALAERHDRGSAPRPAPPLASVLWLLIPVAFVAVFAGMVVIVAGLRRAGVFLLLVRL
jgi:hypothetical protein